MIDYSLHKEQLSRDGFSILPPVYSEEEVQNIIQLIAGTEISGENARRSKDLFAIRQFLKEIPGIYSLVFNNTLKKIIHQIMGENFFVVKSIYFDKPEESNWFVAYHQDLTIPVKNKITMDGYINWTIKQNQFSVQPPLDILERIYTVRIHLDDTDETNGALKIIPGSNKKGICRPENIGAEKENEVTCHVARGGIMLMKPLLLHASFRSTGITPRRVIHIEFCNKELDGGLEWAEKISEFS